MNRIPTPVRPSPRVGLRRRRTLLYFPALVFGLFLTLVQYDPAAGIVTANSVFIFGALIAISAAMAIVIDDGTQQ